MRRFIKSDFARVCTQCKKPTVEFRKYADGTIMCRQCVQQIEVIHAQPQPQNKRGARLQIAA